MRPPNELPPHRARDLVSPSYGVRATAATPDSLLKRVHALTAVTGAIVSHLSAAVLWGFPLPQALDESAGPAGGAA